MADPRSSATDLAVVILTFNEALHIERAIRSVQGIAREIFVVDSYSTDDTVERAQALGATVLQNRFVNQARQFAWGLENLPITAGWILRLDADEIIEDDLAAEIADKLPRLGPETVGVNLKRKHIFLGRWIKHGGRYPLVLLRVWRRGHGRVEDRWMDEHAVVWGGGTVTFDGGFADHNLKDLTFFTAKHNSYATREAIEVLLHRYDLAPKDEGMSAQAASRQASLKRAIKEKVYNRLPFTLTSWGYFLMRYIVQLGFLDGRAGLIYHFLQGYWYRFLVGAKTFEFEQNPAFRAAQTPAERLAALSIVSGHDLTPRLR